MRPVELPPNEAVEAALNRVDAKIEAGHAPTFAIAKVAADIGVEYGRLEHFYIERGRNSSDPSDRRVQGETWA